MKTPDIIASIGVTILLVAFFLNLYGKLSSNSKAYSAMNLIGAAICAVSSYMIRFPFYSTGKHLGACCTGVIIQSSTWNTHK